MRVLFSQRDDRGEIDKAKSEFKIDNCDEKIGFIYNDVFMGAGCTG